MSLWDGIFGRRKVKLSDPAGWNLDLGSKAGKPVTAETSMQLASVWACVRLKSRVVGSLPLMVYKRGADGERELDRKHPLFSLLHQSPNADQTPAEFWGGMVASVDLWGNGYAEKHYSADGKTIEALEPMRPEFTRCRIMSEGARAYDYYPPLGASRTLSEDQVLHIKGFTTGGHTGLSAISYGRETLGIALAADETAARAFSHGLQVSGFLELAAGQKVNPQQRKELMDLFERFTGSSRSGKVMPLEAGWKFVPITINPKDAQLLESRSFNVEEICRWFDVFPILIGHAGAGQTMWGTGVEQLMIGWLTLALDPLLTGIEQAVEKQLLAPADRGRWFVEFKREGLLRADSKGRAELLASEAQNGFRTRNEGRRTMNLPPMPGGDVLTVQSNLIPLDQLGKAPARPTQPAPGEPL